jgi:hypothetical protein
MWNEPSDAELARLPPLYATENTPVAETLIPMHFFLGGCDWYVAEYSPQGRNFFGYAILNDDLQNAEWGYVNYDELRKLKTPNGLEVDRDLQWQTRKASEIERIVQSGGV